MRRHFHRHHACAFVAQTGQQAVHGHHIRSRPLTRGKQRIQAAAQRADGTCRRTGVVQRLRQQLHRRGLAVGAGNANHGHGGGRLGVEAVGDAAEVLAKTRHRKQVGVRRLGGEFIRQRRLEQDGAGACRARLPGESQAMTAETPQGDEGVAAMDFATVGAKAGHDGIACRRHVGETGQQGRQWHAGAHCMPPSVATETVSASCGRPSGPSAGNCCRCTSQPSTSSGLMS